jgi:hypothetical protein
MKIFFFAGTDFFVVTFAIIGGRKEGLLLNVALYFPYSDCADSQARVNLILRSTAVQRRSFSTVNRAGQGREVVMLL